MDEPTSALDPISTLRVEELVQDLKTKLFNYYGYITCNKLHVYLIKQHSSLMVM